MGDFASRADDGAGLDWGLPVLLGCLGAAAAMAQVVLLREMLASVYGNELCIGLVLAGWFIDVSAGALLARLAMRWIRCGNERPWLAGSLGVAAVLVPFQVVFCRVFREVMGVGPGVDVPAGIVMVAGIVAAAPSAGVVGFVFPLACRLWGTRSRPGGISRLYVAESIGSMAGGAGLTFVLLPFGSVGSALATAIALLLVGMGAMLTRRVRWSCLLGALLVGLAGAIPNRSQEHFESWMSDRRMEGLGIRPAAVTAGMPVVRRVAERDTIYQNLILTESAGQFVLYANGRVAAVFPDPIGDEHRVHFLMAQKPDAKRVLLLGGNLAGDVPEYLKYPLESLVRVDLDPGVDALVEAALPDAVREACADPRLRRVREDAPRFLRRCRDSFDVVVVDAPDPSTIAANRYFTEEFHRLIRSVLAPRGVMMTTVSASERLAGESAHVAASVNRTLRSVFPVVRVTAESRPRFLAGFEDSGLTFDRDVLRERSERAAVPARYFRPAYFDMADEIDPAKMSRIEARLQEAPSPINTNLRPVTTYYYLRLWSQWSRSGLERSLGAVRAVGVRGLLGGMLAVGMVAVGVSALRRRRAGAENRPWAKAVLGVLIASTGFCGMAMEMVMIFLFQVCHGYVYARMGMIVACFMMGLAVGGWGAKWGDRISGRDGWRMMLGIEVSLGLLMLGLIPLMDLAAMSEAWIYVFTLLGGAGVGVEFPLANRLYREAGGHAGAAASTTEAADHLGAAAGALAMGVWLIPVLGVAGACLVLVGMKVMGFLLVLSAVPTSTSRDCATGRG